MRYVTLFEVIELTANHNMTDALLLQKRITFLVNMDILILD